MDFHMPQDRIEAARERMKQIPDSIGSTDRLVAAVIEVALALNLQTEVQLEMQIEQRAQNIAREATYPRFLRPPDKEKIMIGLIDERDAIQHQIDDIEAQLEDVTPEMRVLMSATALGPLRERLRGIDQQMSFIQAECEATGGSGIQVD